MRHLATTTARKTLAIAAILLLVLEFTAPDALAMAPKAQTGPNKTAEYGAFAFSYDPTLVAEVTMEPVPDRVSGNASTPDIYEHFEFRLIENGTDGVFGSIAFYSLATDKPFFKVAEGELKKLIFLTTQHPDLAGVSELLLESTLRDLNDDPKVVVAAELPKTPSPWPEGSGYPAHHAAYLDAENGTIRGLRYLTHDEQELNLYYVFQGLSSDGNYWIDARFAVRLPPTGLTPDPMGEVYYANSAADAEFIPSLTNIDVILATLTTRSESGLSPAPQHPTTVAADPQFAYVRDGSIWLRNSQTGVETELVADTQAHDLGWSYDGRFLLYQDGGVASDFDLPTFDGIWTGSSNKAAISFMHAPTARLFVLDLDEATPRPRLLAQNGCCAAWAPDRLAVAYYAPEQMTIHIVDIDGHELQQIAGAADDLKWLGPAGNMVWVPGPPQKLFMVSEQMWVDSGAVTMATYPSLLALVSPFMDVEREKGWVDTTANQLQTISFEDGAAQIVPSVSALGVDGDLSVSPNGQIIASANTLMCAPGPCEPTTRLFTPQGNTIKQEMAGRNYSFIDDTHVLAEVWTEEMRQTSPPGLPEIAEMSPEALAEAQKLWTTEHIGVVSLETGQVTELGLGTDPAVRPRIAVGETGSKPVPSPTLAVSPEEARRWLDEKAATIRSLEKVDISTPLFSIPELNAYNEDAAKALLAQLEGELARGELTPTQLDAFARLTIQERGFAGMLPAYTTVSATLADTASDTIMTGLGLYSAMRPLWAKCSNAMPPCGVIQAKAERLLLKLIRDSGRLFITGIVNDPEQRTANASAWDATLRVVSQKLGDGEPLIQLALNEGIRAGMTAVMLRPYLDRGQGWMEKGIRSADLTNGTGDRYSFTGNTQRGRQAH